MNALEMLTRQAAVALEVVGVAVILIAAAAATVVTVADYIRSRQLARAYRGYRRQLSRGILLGLEFLVGADIIRSVAVEPTFRSVGVLALIVLVRTFLSFTLQLEVTGRWPWQHGAEDGSPALHERDA